MEDLEIAKQTMKEKNLALVFVKDSKVIFESNSSGIKDLLKAVTEFDVKASSVADKIVGKAAAFLLAFSQVKDVFAKVLSKHGLEVLKENRIPYEYETLAERILNKNKTETCPFEKAVEKCKTPEEAFFKLTKLFEKIS
ncbi:MAG: DUF1893 domain-containing protein [Candidatus Aenigmatarchaeota archaeon]